MRALCVMDSTRRARPRDSLMRVIISLAITLVSSCPTPRGIINVFVECRNSFAITRHGGLFRACRWHHIFLCMSLCGIIVFVLVLFLPIHLFSPQPFFAGPVLDSLDPSMALRRLLCRPTSVTLPVCILCGLLPDSNMKSTVLRNRTQGCADRCTISV